MISRSKHLDHVHSDIRGPLYQEALRMEAAGTHILKLNTGNPARFGFELPPSVREALIAQVDRAVPYCDVRGMIEARDSICAYHVSRGLQGITPDDVFICNGVSEAASMLVSALIGAGDEILLPSPCYSLWSNNTYLCGGVPRFYRCDPENDWNPDPDDIRSKVSDRTKAILIINPNNPTGVVYSHEILMEIAEIARQNHLVLLADEIYDRLVMDGLPHESIAALAPDLPCVTFNGLSKSHIVCGFRCGWMVFSGPGLDEIKDGVIIAKRHIHMTPEDAEKYGLEDKQVVSVKVDTAERSLIFGDVVVRVSPKYALAMHIDTDESNAAGCTSGLMGDILA